MDRLFDAEITNPSQGRRTAFQSLLSWIALFDRAISIVLAGSGKCLFQSLLSWIALFDSATSRRATRSGMDACFNPCCRGSPIFDFKGRLLSWLDDWVSILAVLDRPSSTGKALGSDRLRERSGFNPCCRGSRPSSTAKSMLACGTTAQGGFNPCCRGRLSIGTAAHCGSHDRRAVPPPPGEFQSLLSWKSPSSTPARWGLLFSGLSFNLLSWIALFDG